MQIRNTPTSYGVVAKVFHWSIVLFVLLGWLLGTFGDDLPRGAARAAGLFVHITAGLLILLLLVPRVVWRQIDAPPPPEPNAFGAWMDRAATYAHYALYALVLLAPLSGILVQFARGDALPIFGLFDIPSPWTAARATARSVKEVHEFLTNALVAFAAAHAVAALFHHWVLRDRTLLRMLPGRR